MALVLDGSNGTLGNPVDLSGETSGVELGDVPLLLHLDLGAGELGSLLGGPVGELVDTHGPGVASSVVGLHLLDVVGEEGESFSVLGSGGVHLVVLSNESEEFVLVGVDLLILGDVENKLLSVMLLIAIPLS